MAAMLRDSVIAVVVGAVVRTHAQALPLAMITMRIFFCFPYWYGARAAGAKLLTE